jgi:L,D-transpeptidase catalytic domain
MKFKGSLYGAAAALSLILLTVAASAESRSPWFGWGDDEPNYNRSGTYTMHNQGALESHLVGRTPLLAVVALHQQHVTAYDAQGKMLEGGISSGTSGLETPAGIFSVVQKEVEHHSNLFDDALMPYMQRITWTGISLHVGVLPGYPASHGCVRLPDRFAWQLFETSKVGMRVILVRDDIIPAEVPQPAMFSAAASKSDGDVQGRLKSLASQKSQEADAATRRLKDLKTAASKKANEAAAAEKAMHAAETGLANAQEELKAAEHTVETADTPERTTQAHLTKNQAAAKVDAAQAKLDAAKQEAQSKSEASEKAEQEAQAVAGEAAAARDAADEARLDQSPVSVFISRKTQRLYVRKNYIPVYEAPVLIKDADKRIGSFVFTALDYKGSGGTMRWNMVSMYKDALNIEPAEQAYKGKGKVSTEPAAPADVASAQAALSRITVTPEAQEYISRVLLPGSSLIVSDEGMHSETGKDTDFIVIMPGEPMGGLMSRNKPSSQKEIADGFFGGWSFSSPSSSSRSRRSGSRGRSEDDFR